ncbi:MAG TPA: protein kinase [Ktedonobacteraceae bacterium]|nr:protein kinase [Ktedonobacteraceae bacterium]
MDIKELIGVTLGTCTLERIIGRGGMGAVYLAQQARPVRTVAVKVLIPSNTYDPDQQRVFLERFRREADTIAKLEHKNILPIYEYDEALINAEHLAYLVMPFIRGGTLRERIDEMNRSGSHFDLKVIANYINQVADALSYAHSLGVIHRDIKPGNLLFHQDGRLLLSDFGIVRLKAMPSLTSIGSFIGTAEYASPEQISTSEIDFRSDIYSLGTILYELLTGSAPYTGATPFAIMAEKLSKPVPSLLTIRPDLSPGIEAVVMKALAKNPADRYQTATMLAADLRASAASSSSSALRLSGDADNNDLTVAERPWGVVAPLNVAAPTPNAPNFIPPTQPARPIPPGNASWQQAPGQWQWPSQAQAQSPVGLLAPGVPNSPLPYSAYEKTDPNNPPKAPNAPMFREARRAFYYGTACIALLLQFLVVVLVFTPGKDGTQIVALLGVLTGSGINLLALAALAFAAVTRGRPIRRFLYRGLIATLLAPLLSGLFINLGGANDHPLPIAAYLILLISNLYVMRQLGKVDAAKEQVIVAPVHWWPATMGALTGLLPLVIILTFALEAPFSHLQHVPPLFNMLGTLFVVFIGTPTPGAVMAIRLSENMRFPDLLRSSAISGMLMFAGASILAVIWGLLFPNHTQFLYALAQPGVATAMLIIIAVLTVLGSLRGMLDAWIYQRIRKSGKTTP